MAKGMLVAVADGAIYFGKLAVIAVLIWAAILTPATVLAQSVGREGKSCIVDFERFSIAAWNRYDACIVGTNGHTAFGKLTNRPGCRIDTLSDTVQAYADYVSCMSIGRLWVDRREAGPIVVSDNRPEFGKNAGTRSFPYGVKHSPVSRWEYAK